MDVDLAGSAAKASSGAMELDLEPTDPYTDERTHLIEAITQVMSAPL